MRVEVCRLMLMLLDAQCQSCGGIQLVPLMDEHRRRRVRLDRILLTDQLLRLLLLVLSVLVRVEMMVHLVLVLAIVLAQLMLVVLFVLRTEMLLEGCSSRAWCARVLMDRVYGLDGKIGARLDGYKHKLLLLAGNLLLLLLLLYCT